MCNKSLLSNFSLVEGGDVMHRKKNWKASQKPVRGNELMTLNKRRSPLAASFLEIHEQKSQHEDRSIASA